jgi:hypothetical protein
MSGLLEMEPRVAGTHEVEPVVEFEQRWRDVSERAECPATVIHITAPTC